MQTLSAQIIFLAAVAISLLGMTITAQSFLDERKLNQEIDVLLKTRDLTDAANELAGPAAASTRETLRSIIIFARAGHQDRVAKAIAQLSMSLPENHEDRFHLNRIVRRAIDREDLISQKLFYERFAPEGDDRVPEFVTLWRKTGDVKEIESWLTPRSRRYDSLWWEHLWRLKTELGTSEDLIDGLVADLRANPNDQYLLQRYFWVAGPMRDVSWLLELVPSDSSYRFYELASTVSPYSPELAIKALGESLELAFTRADQKLFAERAFRGAAVMPTGINVEKQLRFWSLKLLARLYSEQGRPELAQPYVEKLTAMDTSDIQADDQYRLAGRVQAASGHRVVEARILQNEATNREQPEYWIERANYYKGRQEPDLVLASYKQGLAIFPYSRTGPNQKRLKIFQGLANIDESSQKAEIKDIFRVELAKSEANPGYKFGLARAFLSKYRDLVDEHFVDTGRLPQVLQSRERWRQDEEYLMIEVLNGRKWDAEKREAVLRNLSRLTRGKIRERAFSLAAAMVETYEYRHAIPLLEGCRKIAGPEYTGEMNFTREDVDRKLFESYIAVADWRRAKAMYDGGYAYWGNELGEIAVSAANSGDVENAFRVWQLNANLDRRKLEGLDTLSKTAAKPILQELYLKIKKRDPLSYVPDKALAILK